MTQARHMLSKELLNLRAIFVRNSPALDIDSSSGTSVAITMQYASDNCFEYKNYAIFSTVKVTTKSALLKICTTEKRIIS